MTQGKWRHFFYMKKHPKLGLSTKRAECISDWCRKLVYDLGVHPGEMASGLGRLGYAANALYLKKPFLGPIYAWSLAIAGKTSKVRLHCAIAVLLTWISRRFSEGGRLQSPPVLKEEPVELFRADAKAEGGKAFIGGWEINNSRDQKFCRWF